MTGDIFGPLQEKGVTGRDQGCCRTSCNAQDRPYNRVIQPQMLLVPRLRNARVDTGLQRWCQLMRPRGFPSCGSGSSVRHFAVSCFGDRSPRRCRPPTRTAPSGASHSAPQLTLPRTELQRGRLPPGLPERRGAGKDPGAQETWQLLPPAIPVIFVRMGKAFLP